LPCEKRGMRKNARFARRILPGLAIAALAVPAQAQVANASYRSMTKTEAILGGASALAAITTQQGGRPAYSSYVVPARTSYLHAAVTSYDRQPVSSDRPDIFNSVALTIGRSPLDARWHQVAGAGVGGAAGGFAASLRGEAVIAKLEAVNSYVNARVRFVDDRVQFGVADRWMPASETLARGRGDCEDFALAKRAMLRAAGVPDKDLYLVVLKDLTRRADHAVLVVRAAGRFLVLDNGTDRIADSSEVQDYKPVLTFTATNTYTHGYRREVPPVTYASSDTRPLVTLAETRFEPSSGDDDLPAVLRETASLVPTTISL
jgi:predicted transglutaminase-like cysteine proteinase